MLLKNTIVNLAWVCSMSFYVKLITDGLFVVLHSQYVQCAYSRTKETNNPLLAKFLAFLLTVWKNYRKTERKPANNKDSINCVLTAFCNLASLLSQSRREKVRRQTDGALQDATSHWEMYFGRRIEDLASRSTNVRSRSDGSRRGTTFVRKCFFFNFSFFFFIEGLLQNQNYRTILYK